ncbi:hypothetical protein APSETT444_010432 [Aspergillus pseudonomiae]
MDVLPAYPGTHGVDKKEDEYSADAEKRDIAAGQVQDAFGSEEDAEIKYKTLTWWYRTRGVILIVGLGLLALYTGYNIGLFRERYPHIQSLADAGEILLGRFGRELFGLGQFLFCIFVMGSHILTFRVMMNTITEHATCSIVFSVVGMLISMILSIPRTMKGMTWVSFASFLSIFGAVMITMISVSVQDFPGRTIDATVETNLYTGFQAVSNIVFAYCAHVAFFGLIAEMENPKDFNKSLLMLQSFEICLYLTAAVVIYYYVGTDVHSPALTSAGPVMKKVAYGIAIPTIVGAGVVNGHIGLKYIYFRACRKSDLLHSRSWKSVSIWLALGFVCWVVAWIISEGIPVFSNLNSLILWAERNLLAASELWPMAVQPK